MPVPTTRYDPEAQHPLPYRGCRWVTSHFPGQIGASYGKRPTELIDREREALEIWLSHRPEDRADLVYPVYTVPQAREKLFEVFRLQNQRTDHNCEGTDQIVEAYDGNLWVPATTAHVGCPVRTRMESPMERAAKLIRQNPGEWSRVSPEILTAFYEHTMRRRPVEQNGEITFMHEGKVLRFGPPADEFALAPVQETPAQLQVPDQALRLVLGGHAHVAHEIGRAHV